MTDMPERITPYSRIIKALAEMLTKYQGALLHEKSSNPYVDIGGYVQTIRNAADEMMVSPWIPVSERLPDEDGEYVVMFPDGHCEVDTWRGNWFGYPYQITHWMPIPPRSEK